MRSYMRPSGSPPVAPFTVLLIAFLVLLLSAWLTLGFLFNGPSLAATTQNQAITIELTPFATGFNKPVDIVHTGDDRLFVVQQDGIIRIVQPDGTLLPTPFLDINSRVETGGSEQGLLGMAFEPGSTSVLYLNYTRKDSGSTIIARYRVTGNDPNVADPASEEIVLQVEQPYRNHNAGDLAFGADGFLYIPLGDGGSGGDPEDRAQDLRELLGKILRIDVTGVQSYTIPPGNPYATDNNPESRAEIWAVGVRNPWRISFDRQTHDLYIGDVGQSAYEEISFQPAASMGGENYGWDCREGAHPYTPGEQSPNCSPGGSYIEPIFEYTRDENQSNPSAPCSSITGGFVYRGAAYPALVGHYILADYCSGKFWSLIRDSQNQWTSTAHGKLMNNPSSFGEDQNGELYVASRSDGVIYRITTNASVTPTPTATLVPTTTLIPTIPPDQDRRIYLPFIKKDGTNE
jgi:glucose/arabinose dehydrogenase